MELLEIPNYVNYAVYRGSLLTLVVAYMLLKVESGLDEKGNLKGYADKTVKEIIVIGLTIQVILLIVLVIQNIVRNNIL